MRSQDMFFFFGRAQCNGPRSVEKKPNLGAVFEWIYWPVMGGGPPLLIYTRGVVLGKNCNEVVNHPPDRFFGAQKRVKNGSKNPIFRPKSIDFDRKGQKLKKPPKMAKKCHFCQFPGPPPGI